MSEKKRDVLPTTLKPTHYDLEVFDINVTTNTFGGKVVISLDVKEDTDKIVLHASNIEFQDIKVTYSLTKTESQVTVKETTFDEKFESATISLHEQLKAGGKATLEIKYTARIRDNMEGFYRSEYKDKDGKDQVMLSTQFEAVSARSALPCFDEPNLKASFQLTITVASEFTVLSNTPVVSSKVLDDGKKKGAIEAVGLKVVKFQETPLMSTYLLAWAIGKVDYVEALTEKSYNGKKIPVRVYTQEGISEQGRLGLEVATKVVDLFSEVFDIDYVLPKLDLISVPAYSHNAMENWGLITFRPTALLFDSATSAPAYKKKVAYVVAHELAHQWFGNLVTMDWWDELWLNEGFATWVGYYAIDRIFPEWRIFDQNTMETLQQAMEVDALRGSHPVEVPIQSSSDIDQVFDHISYCKGGSVIHQFAKALGTDTFLKGVSHYLKKHKFANGTTKNLWESISEVSGEDVVAMADNWITKIGFPYVTVEQDDEGNVTFTQNRFLSAGDATEEENQTIWWIPLNISTGPSDADKIVETLSTRSTTVKGLASTHEFFKVNKNSDGLYRVVYDTKTLDTIKKNISKLSVTDRAGLIADATVTAVAGLTKTSDLLSLLKLFKGETDSVVWTAILESLKTVKSAWYEQPQDVQDGLSELFKEIVTPSALSFDFDTSSEDFLTEDLRVRLLGAGVSAGVPEIVKSARDLYEKYKSGETVDPALRGVILDSIISVSTATESDFDDVFAIIDAPGASLDTREIVLGSLGSVANEELAFKAASLILDERVPIMDLQFVAYPLAQNGKARAVFWKYFQDNYDAIYARLNTNRVVFDRFIKFTLCYFASMESHAEIKKLFEGKDLYGFERSLDQVLDSVETRAKWVLRDAEDVASWLKNEGYITAV
ncbi:CYFA0S03e05160g1_1 [Cyberlindnera fabianii]|uniref:Aminopeptidase n=1 Tax=Cyberlindnera fabianii TaxID=36022 RepID=A0A061APY7_CYBFA|nr:CYFA0S03e05160g1_1 [Cyberlindnera fabianii]